MKDMTTLKHIAGLYLDIYSTPRDLTRPLTPEQVKDAGVFFLDLLAAHEAEMLIALERQQQPASQPEPTYQEIAEMFARRYKRESGLGDHFTVEDWDDATELFRDQIGQF